MRFALPVRKDFGVALFVVQIGDTPRSAKPWKGLGPGIYELVEDHRGDTYRAVYTVRIAGKVYVLHAFQKKSKSGIKTPRPDIDLIERRLKAVLARYREGRD
ncbi:MAG TPA: type II toxin-antitoxin system RelE/ParE family toxin [Stellaceae bacterium]|nr:type II toxin-antitoxin system RelE/ParE family toxin [Stellaceae bacterium]